MARPRRSIPPPNRAAEPGDSVARGHAPLGIAGLIVLLVLLAAQLQLLVSHLNPDAPARKGFGRDTELAHRAADQDRLERNVADRVGGRSVQVRFAGPPSPTSDMANAGFYFGMNYVLWPNRAVAGDGRAVVKDAETLRAAAAPVPSDAALPGRAAVVTFRFSPQAGVHVDVRPLATGGRP